MPVTDLLNEAAAEPGYAVALHGGAGVLDDSSLDQDTRATLHTALRECLRVGEEILGNNGSALDAVQGVVEALENSPHFNAGHGACLTWDGTHELDAAIMCGSTLECGAVAGARHIRNPIRAARAVMEKSDHVLVSGSGADAFAEHRGLEPVDNAYFTTPMRRQQWEDLKNKPSENTGTTDSFQFGTVGAVAFDRNGRLAAATSTGGITNKRWGRIGDSPLVGAGTLADDRSCAISCTGSGEHFIRQSVAHEISAQVRLANRSTSEVIEELLNGPLDAPGGLGGIISIDRAGRIVLGFNTRGMYRAWYTEGGSTRTAIESKTVMHD